MKYLFLLLFFPITLCAQDWTSKVGARTVPAASSITQVKNADNTGATIATKAIQSAIDAAAAKGGGTVTLAPGKYLTGSLFIKEGVTLTIDKNVELLGSQNFDDYPEIDTRIAGIEMRWPRTVVASSRSFTPARTR